MLNKIILLAGLTCYSMTGMTQKRAIDYADLDSWPSIMNEQISNDGSIVIYTVTSGKREDSLFIQHTDGRLVLKTDHALTPVITEDSRYVLYKKNDSLFIYEPAKQKLEATIPSILHFRIPVEGNGKWLAYQKKDIHKTIVLHDLSNGSELVYENGVAYQFAPDGSAVVLQQKIVADKDTANVLIRVEIPSRKTVFLMQRYINIRNVTFDNTGEQMAFLSDERKDGQMITTLRYFRMGMDSAVIKAGNTTAGMNGLTIGTGLVRFSPNGERLFFSIKPKPQPAKPVLPNAADVTIWQYDEDTLISERNAYQHNIQNRMYTAVIGTDDSKVIRLDEEGDQSFVELGNDGNGDHVLLRQKQNYFAPRWMSSTMPSYYLKSIRTGARKLVISQREPVIGLSAEGKYVWWYDLSKKAFFTYNVATDAIVNISAGIPVSLEPMYYSNRLVPAMPAGVAGWLPGDKALFVYDQCDIWKLDPDGARAPVNLTNGYGRKNNIIFRIWNKDGRDYNTPAFTDKEVLLIAFDTANKNNGFFKKDLATSGDPVKLSLDPYLYYAHARFNMFHLESGEIKKAKNTGVYILHRMNEKEYPNLYVTKDFKQFKQVSSLAPEKKYNWLTTELIAVKMADGNMSEGILYKPENFDPNKKYPVIFYFYERLSHRLHQYIDPDLGDGSINIPFYVSNGYLVYTPDISYKIAGKTGEHALNAVTAAAQYLAGKSWVDAKRMGIQGHSFGGFQVNYIIANSTLFAAAQESAGASDFISYYNGFYRETNAQTYFEHGQGRIAATLWENPQAYISNSPVYRADKVVTPLLIMHNKEDGEVPVQQGLEWFLALRRLEKPVWLLQYDKEYHGIVQRKNRLDYSIRTKEFFDHYLKGETAPQWMIRK